MKKENGFTIIEFLTIICIICIILSIVLPTCNYYKAKKHYSPINTIKIVFPDGETKEYNCEYIHEIDKKLYLKIVGEEVTKTISGYSYYEVTEITVEKNK